MKGICTPHTSPLPCVLPRKPRSFRSLKLQQQCKCVRGDESSSTRSLWIPRRRMMEQALTLALGAQGAAVMASCAPAHALPGFKKDLNKRRKAKVPESEFKEGPQGLKYYDVVLGKGAEVREGARAVVHYEARWRGVTFMTSRQGMGVTGGEPLGFDVGAQGAGGTLKGLDLGVRGMRTGGQRKLIVPPELAYGKRGIGEVPPDATLEFEVEVLSVKTSPFGYRTKLVEG